MRLKILVLSAVFLVLTAPSAQAAVTFTSGFWMSTFSNCAAQDVPAGSFCSGLEADDPGYTCNSTSPSRHSAISSAANYPSGGGGLGYRMYQGATRNDDSSGIALRFAASQPEVWIRYYTRYPVGQAWGGIVEHKMIYALTDSSVALDVNFPAGMHAIELQPRNTMGSPDIFINGWGWNDLYGGDVGDGAWHRYEHHFKLGASGQNNGVYQFWVDGIIRVNRTNLDFFNGGTASPRGWSQVIFPSNHNVSAVPGCNPVDIDDVAVAIPSYAGFAQDAQGNPMIGGIGGAPPTRLPAPPNTITVPPSAPGQ